MFTVIDRAPGGNLPSTYLQLGISYFSVVYLHPEREENGVLSIELYLSYYCLVRRHTTCFFAALRITVVTCLSKNSMYNLILPRIVLLAELFSVEWTRS